MRIGFVGAGRMGRAMIDCLRRAGHEPTVLTRRPEARASAEADGLRCADTVTEVVRDADVVFCAVFSEAQVMDVLPGAIADMPSGAVMVQHTTCDPATASRLAGLGAGRGIAVLDAALSGTPRDVTAGRLTLWVGGDAGALERVRPLLDTYAAPVLTVGPPGNGQRLKLVNNALFVAQVGLALDAVRLGAAMGLSAENVLPALEHGSGASRALSAVGWIGIDQVTARLAELMLKDVDVLTAVAARSGTDLGLLGEVLGSDAVRTRVLAGGSPPDRTAAEATGAMKGPSHG